MDDCTVEFESDRLNMCLLTLDDAPFMQELLNSPGWKQYIGDRGIRSESHARQYLRGVLLKGYLDWGFGYYAIRMKTSGQPVGICGFTEKKYLDHPDIGYALLPQFTSRGFAIESTKACLEYGLKNHDINTVQAVVLKENHRSIKLLERLGFEHQNQVEHDGEELELYQKSNI